MKNALSFIEGLIGLNRKTWLFGVDVALFFSAWLANFWGHVGKDLYESTFLLTIIYALMAFDFGLGFIREYRKGNAETKRGLQWVFKFIAYTIIYVLVTALAGVNPSKYGWLPTGISLPMVLITLISIVKNMALLGLVPVEWALAVLKNIDQYKEGSGLDYPEKKEDDDKIKKQF